MKYKHDITNAELEFSGIMEFIGGISWRFLYGFLLLLLYF